LWRTLGLPIVQVIEIPASGDMNITGSTRVFFILGDPIAQVRAPEIYNHLFSRHGVDAVLVPVQVSPVALEGFVRGAMSARNIDGLWITVPHKAALLGLLDRCDPLGRAAGAVNAARRNADGTLEGALFDGTGFAKALEHFNIPVAGRRVLLVGAGGAGMAIAASLATRGLAELALFDVGPGRAHSVAQRVRAAFAQQISTPDSSDPAAYDLVINATPLGLKGSDPLPFDVTRVDAHAVVVDILMTRQATPLLKACAARGIRAHAGYEMLVQQIPEYLSFFGFDSLARELQADSSEVRALLQPR
jgi:shikimate dehydrogenase